MKPSDLWTPKGRRAVGKLSLDLLKITGKVAVAGTTSLVGALASAAISTKLDSNQFATGEKDHTWSCPLDVEDGYHTYGPAGPGYYLGGIKIDK